MMMTGINKLFLTTVNMTLVGYLLALFPSYVTPIEESFCAGVGFINYTHTTKPFALRSMGAASVFSHPLSTFWGTNHAYAGVDRPDTVHLTISRVEYTSSSGGTNELNGWLHINLKRVKSDHYTGLAIWAVTNKREAVGEFVYLGKNGCGSSNWGEAANYIPCSAVPIDAPMPTNMFIFTNPDTKTKLTEVNLLWRANWNYCDKPESFYFLFAINPNSWSPYKDVKPFKLRLGFREYGPIIYLSSMIYPKYYGAASSLPDKSKISCKKDILKHLPVWLRKLPVQRKPGRGILTNISKEFFYKPRWDISTGKEVIKHVLERQVCKAQHKDFVNFGGRCLGKVEDLAWKNKKLLSGSLNQPPICPKDNYDIEMHDKALFQGVFPDFLTKTRKSNVLENCKCPVVPTLAELNTVVARVYSFKSLNAGYKRHYLDARDYKTGKIGCREYKDLDYHKHGLCLESFAGLAAFGSREWHTMATLLTTMVLVPVNGFVARYMKGALLVSYKNPILHIPVNTWYISHVLFVLPITCMYITSLSTIHRQRASLGVSQDKFAMYHRWSGYALMLVFLLQCLFGFLRPLNIRLRKVAIFFHWLGGVILHYGGTIVAILTYRIPASPTSFYNHLDDQHFPYLQNHIPALVLVASVVVDLSFHVFLTRYLVQYDHERLEMRVRPFFPIFLPMRMDVYYSGTQEDLLRDELKHVKKFFYVYLSVCVLVYIFTLLCILFYRRHTDLGFGPMTCTHDELGHYLSAEGMSNNKSLKELHLITRFCS